MNKITRKKHIERNNIQDIALKLEGQGLSKGHRKVKSL